MKSVVVVPPLRGLETLSTKEEGGDLAIGESPPSLSRHHRPERISILIRANDFSEVPR